MDYQLKGVGDISGKALNLVDQLSTDFKKNLLERSRALSRLRGSVRIESKDVELAMLQIAKEVLESAQ